jgi:hypothetical protein
VCERWQGNLKLKNISGKMIQNICLAIKLSCDDYAVELINQKDLLPFYLQLTEGIKIVHWLSKLNECQWAHYILKELALYWVLKVSKDYLWEFYHCKKYSST